MSATRTSFLAFLAALFLAGPASAACQDELGELRDRVAKLQTEGSQEQSTSVSTTSGDVQVKAEAEGAEPKENWFGQSASPEAAKQELEKAQTAAGNGNEETCRHHVEQARKIIDALKG
jgi:hypothetical protein